MSGKSGGTTGAHYDTEEEVEKEEKDPPQAEHMRGDVSYFSRRVRGCFSPTTETLGRQCPWLLLSEDRLLQRCLLWFGATLLVLETPNVLASIKSNILDWTQHTTSCNDFFKLLQNHFKFW